MASLHLGRMCVCACVLGGGHLKGWHWWRRHQSEARFALWTAILLLLQAWKWLHLYHLRDVLCHIRHLPPHSSVPLHFLIFPFRCVIMNLPALLFRSPSSSSSSPSPHHTFIPLALSRRPPRPPLLLSTPWLCSVSSSPSSPPRRRRAGWRYSTLLKLHANAADGRRAERRVDQFQECLATFYYSS